MMKATQLMLLFAVVASGCVGDELGPLRVHLESLEVHDPRNVTLQLMIENQGTEEVHIGREGVSVGPRVLDLDTKMSTGSGSILENGKQKLGTDILHEGEILGPSEVRPVSLDIYYSPAGWKNVTPAYYEFDVSAEYRTGNGTETKWFQWSYDPPCFAADGEPIVIKGTCDGDYFVFGGAGRSTSTPPGPITGRLSER